MDCGSSSFRLLALYSNKSTLPEDPPVQISSQTQQGDYVYIDTDKVWKLDGNSDWHYYLACDTNDNFCIIVVGDEGDFYRLFALQQQKVSGMTKFFDIRNTDEKQLKAAALDKYKFISRTNIEMEEFEKVIGDYVLYSGRDPYEWKDLFILAAMFLGLLSLFGTFPRLFYYMRKSYEKDRNALGKALDGTMTKMANDAVAGEEIHEPWVPAFDVPYGERKVFRASLGVVMVFEVIILIMILVVGGIMISGAIDSSLDMSFVQMLITIVIMIAVLDLPFVIWWFSVLVVTQDYVMKRSPFAYKKVEVSNCLVNSADTSNRAIVRCIGIYKKSKPNAHKPYISIMVDNYKHEQRVELLRIFIDFEIHFFS